MKRPENQKKELLIEKVKKKDSCLAEITNQSKKVEVRYEQDRVVNTGVHILSFSPSAAYIIKSHSQIFAFKLKIRKAKKSSH